MVVRWLWVGILHAGCLTVAWSQPWVQPYVPIVVGGLRLGMPFDQVPSVHRRDCVVGARSWQRQCRSQLTLGGAQVPVVLHFFDGQLNGIDGHARLADRDAVMRQFAGDMGPPRRGSDDRLYWVSGPREKVVDRDLHPHALRILPESGSLQREGMGVITAAPGSFEFIAEASLDWVRLQALVKSEPPPANANAGKITALIAPRAASAIIRAEPPTFARPPDTVSMRAEAPKVARDGRGLANRSGAEDASSIHRPPASPSPPSGAYSQVLQVGDFRLGMPLAKVPARHLLHCKDGPDDLSFLCYTSIALGGVPVSLMFSHRDGIVRRVAGHFALEGYPVIQTHLLQTMGTPYTHHPDAITWSTPRSEGSGVGARHARLYMDRRGERVNAYGLDDRSTETGYRPRSSDFSGFQMDTVGGN